MLKVNDIKEIYYSPGSPAYYMGDEGEVVEEDYHVFPDAWFFEKNENGSTIRGIIHEKELFDEYKIKLIKWDYTKPIQNKFH